MSKSKTEMLTEILEMDEEVRKRFPDAKIKENHLSLHEDAHDLPADMIREGYKWLFEIFTNEYAAVATVRRLLSEEQWDRYLKWGGFEDHQECVLMREKMIPFRAALVSRNRPNLFKKGVVNVELKNRKNSKKGS